MMDLQKNIQANTDSKNFIDDVYSSRHVSVSLYAFCEKYAAPTV